LVGVDPRTGQVVAVIPVGARPPAVVFSSGALWVANLDDRTVSRVDLRTDRVVRTIPTLPLGTLPAVLAAGAGGVWYAGSRPGGGAVAARIDPRFDTIGRRVHIGRSSFGAPGIAAGRHSVWAASGGVGPLARVDPARARVIGTVDTHSCCPGAVALAAGALWSADPYADTVTRLDPPDLFTP